MDKSDNLNRICAKITVISVENETTLQRMSLMLRRPNKSVTNVPPDLRHSHSTDLNHLKALAQVSLLGDVHEHENGGSPSIQTKSASFWLKLTIQWQYSPV